jgi:osmotically-inducible protein OsmY
VDVRDFLLAMPATERELLNPPDVQYNLPPAMVAMPLANRDRQLQKAVEYKLNWNPFLDPTEVHVSVVDGIVTLTGTVDSWMESGVAEDSALKAGAGKVVNKLKVRR